MYLVNKGKDRLWKLWERFWGLGFEIENIVFSFILLGSFGYVIFFWLKNESFLYVGEEIEIFRWIYGIGFILWWDLE